MGGTHPLLAGEHFNFFCIVFYKIAFFSPNFIKKGCAPFYFLFSILVSRQFDVDPLILETSLIDGVLDHLAPIGI